jgi:hypothetical protein
MRRIALVALALLALVSPAVATELLPTLTITTAVSALTSTPLQSLTGSGRQFLPTNMALQATFTYGSGGTSADAWVQTSFDGGTTWEDVANFHFTTSSARPIYNLSSLTVHTTQVTPTDGTLAANTANDGIFGTQWRVKYTTVGTYAGGTTLRVDAISNGLTGN